MKLLDCLECRQDFHCGKCICCAPEKKIKRFVNGMTVSVGVLKHWNKVRRGLKSLKVKRFPRYPRFPRFVGRKERTSEGSLRCICGKRQQWYCGKYKRGICSNECFELLDTLHACVRSFR